MTLQTYQVAASGPQVPPWSSMHLIAHILVNPLLWKPEKPRWFLWGDWKVPSTTPLLLLGLCWVCADRGERIIHLY